MSKQHTWTTQCIIYSPSAHLLSIKHSLQFICYTWIKRTCSANAPLKPCMTEPKDNIAMQPFVCSYCSDWSIHSYRIQTPLAKGVRWWWRWGFPVFILPFEMLLQLPEQKLHCHLVMALHSHPPHSHGAVRQQQHIHSRVSAAAVCPWPSLFSVGFFVLFFLKTNKKKNQPHTTRALLNSAC